MPLSPVQKLSMMSQGVKVSRKKTIDMDMGIAEMTLSPGQARNREKIHLPSFVSDLSLGLLYPMMSYRILDLGWGLERE